MIAQEVHNKVVAALNSFAAGGITLWEHIATNEISLDPGLLSDMTTHQKLEGTSIASKVAVPFGPELRDLACLWVLTQAVKPIVTLELGSGYSTKILARSAQRLGEQRGGISFNLDRSSDKPFHVWSVDESWKWSRVAKERLSAQERTAASLSRSAVKVFEVGSALTTHYVRLPDVKPDFIYIDGPSQYATAQKKNGLSVNKSWRMPMSSDLLRLEWLLEPGAVVCVDGRVQNVQFLTHNLQREWAISSIPELDQTVMTLVSPVLGEQNSRKLHWQLAD